MASPFTLNLQPLLTPSRWSHFFILSKKSSRYRVPNHAGLSGAFPVLAMNILHSGKSQSQVNPNISYPEFRRGLLPFPTIYCFSSCFNELSLLLSKPKPITSALDPTVSLALGTLILPLILQLSQSPPFSLAL